MLPRMSAGPDHTYSWLDDLIRGIEVDHTRVLQRDEILLQVACAVPFVRVRGVFPLGGSNEVSRASESRLQRVVNAGGCTAEVIEVQMRRQCEIDRCRLEARFCERMLQMTRPIERVDVTQL